MGDPEDLKQAILTASLQLGSELGEDGLTMRGIARRLGVSATALYQHFESKASILDEIRSHGHRRLAAAVSPAFDEPNPVDCLYQLGRAYLMFARENPWLYRLVTEGPDIDWAGLGAEERARRLWAKGKAEDAFRRGVTEGKLRADLDVSLAPHLLWAALHGMALLLLRGRIPDGSPLHSATGEPVELVDRFVEGIVRGYLA